jgi:hypothetical protein
MKLLPLSISKMCMTQSQMAVPSEMILWATTSTTAKPLMTHLHMVMPTMLTTSKAKMASFSGNTLMTQRISRESMLASFTMTPLEIFGGRTGSMNSGTRLILREIR